MVEESLLEQQRRAGVGVTGFPVDFPLKPQDRLGRQADVATADTARADVDVLLVDCQRGEIANPGGIAETSDLQHIGPTFELGDVAVLCDEHFFVRPDAYRAEVVLDLCGDAIERTDRRGPKRPGCDPESRLVCPSDDLWLVADDRFPGPDS